MTRVSDVTEGTLVAVYAHPDDAAFGPWGHASQSGWTRWTGQRVRGCA